MASHLTPEIGMLINMSSPVKTVVKKSKRQNFETGGSGSL